MSASAPVAGGRTGVWFLGARGSVATTAAVGALAISDDLVEPTGLVTSIPGLADAGWRAGGAVANALALVLFGAALAGAAGAWRQRSARERPGGPPRPASRPG